MDLYHNKDVESLQRSSFYREEVARPRFFMTLNKIPPAETGPVGRRIKSILAQELANG